MRVNVLSHGQNPQLANLLAHSLATGISRPPSPEKDVEDEFLMDY